MNWLPKKKVIVPVDFSEVSFEAIGTALQLVASPAHVVVVHVLQDVATLEPTEAWHSIDTPARVQQVAKLLRQRLDGMGYHDVVLEVLIGDPGHEISEFAAKGKVELIVVPSHGRTGIRRLLIGSVAERIVRLAHCPVLVLRK